MLHCHFMPDASMDFEQFLTYMIGSNNAAAEVVRLMLEFSGPRSANALNYLDGMNIRGVLLWYCFNDICQRDMKLFFSRIEDRSVAVLLENTPHANYRVPS